MEVALVVVVLLLVVVVVGTTAFCIIFTSLLTISVNRKNK
jgi:hypothetical protein